MICTQSASRSVLGFSLLGVTVDGRSIYSTNLYQLLSYNDLHDPGVKYFYWARIFIINTRPDKIRVTLRPQSSGDKAGPLQDSRVALSLDAKREDMSVLFQHSQKDVNP